jgi:hypothetical protein
MVAKYFDGDSRSSALPQMSRRAATTAIGAGLLTLFARSGAALAQSANAPDYSFVHPELRSLVPSLVKMTSSPKFTPDLIAAARKAASSAPSKFRDDIAVIERRVPCLAERSTSSSTWSMQRRVHRGRRSFTWTGAVVSWDRQSRRSGMSSHGPPNWTAWS